MSDAKQIEYKRIINKAKIVGNYGSAKVYLADGRYHVFTEKNGIVEIGRTTNLNDASYMAADFDKKN